MGVDESNSATSSTLTPTPSIPTQQPAKRRRLVTSSATITSSPSSRRRRLRDLPGRRAAAATAMASPLAAPLSLSTDPPTATVAAAAATTDATIDGDNNSSLSCLLHSGVRYSRDTLWTLCLHFVPKSADATNRDAYIMPQLSSVSSCHKRHREITFCCVTLTLCRFCYANNY